MESKFIFQDRFEAVRGKTPQNGVDFLMIEDWERKRIAFSRIEEDFSLDFGSHSWINKMPELLDFCKRILKLESFK